MQPGVQHVYAAHGPTLMRKPGLIENNLLAGARLLINWIMSWRNIAVWLSEVIVEYTHTLLLLLLLYGCDKPMKIAAGFFHSKTPAIIQLAQMSDALSKIIQFAKDSLSIYRWEFLLPSREQKPLIMVRNLKRIFILHKSLYDSPSNFNNAIKSFQYHIIQAINERQWSKYTEKFLVTNWRQRQAKKRNKGDNRAQVCMCVRSLRRVPF